MKIATHNVNGVNGRLPVSGCEMKRERGGVQLARLAKSAG
jgi:hypothetical protein